MLDFDLAALYEVQTKVLNQAVKRNIKRFPEGFYVSSYQYRISKYAVTICDRI